MWAGNKHRIFQDLPAPESTQKFYPEHPERDPWILGQ